MKRRLQTWLEAIWYGDRRPSWPLRMLAAIFAWLSARRRRRQQARQQALPLPVVVVGNISVGGTGKTPMVVWLVEQLRAMGYSPGLVSRGYGGRARHWPQFVETHSDPLLVGDEPVLLVRRTGCAMVVGPDRVAAVRALCEKAPVDVVISDDGLQHYRMARRFEVAVIDGVRGLGNQHLLPAGPLREPAERLEEVDLVVCNSGRVHGHGRSVVDMHVLLADAVNLRSGEQRPLASFSGATVDAVAGIGHPQRFFERLEAAGLGLRRHAFADHHQFQPADLALPGEQAILMTEKDAVKCSAFASERCWSVPASAVFDTRDSQLITALLHDSLETHT